MDKNKIGLSGNDIPVLIDEESTGTATVVVMVVHIIPTLNLWSIFTMMLMMLGLGFYSRQKYNIR